ncbi:slit homolog 2 protein-like [Sycon ciliatum]|uniref:slit homolog 2 protein-like n=1 Tax=Sycon ciliatum TaxID=27933 RepID=UPI0031F6CDD9
MVLQFKMSIHTVLSLVICYYVLTGTTVMSCPASCPCDGAPRYTVYCFSRRLTMVPGGIPNTTMTLYLDGNQIQKLSAGVFSGLTNLQTLDLRNNQIQTLSDGVFSGLTNLQSLLLGNNQIQNLSDGVFSGLTNLRVLWLNFNPLILTPSLYVSLYGIGTISSNPGCYGCVYVNSWVAVYLNQVSKSCAPGHFQKFNNNGSFDYYCRCNESVPVITPNCSSPGYTCLANGQFPICFGYTQCEKAGSTYICTCENELSLNQSYCYMAKDCQNTVEDCGNGNCTMDYPPESRINKKLNQPSNPRNGIYSTDTISAENTTLTVKCKTDFRNDQSAIQSTMKCQYPGTWITLRAEPCRLPFNCSDSPCQPKRQTCTDIEKGGFVCNCSNGYAKNYSTDLCEDINECDGVNICDSSSSYCVNQPGNYTCECKNGFSKRDNTSTGFCMDINECDILDVCNRSSSYCDNQPGSYTCECKNGFIKKDNVCTGLNCSHASCDTATQQCTDIKGGSFICNCTTAYTKNEKTGLCDDIDECSTGDVCGSSTSDCVNQPGKYTCTCKVGYIKKGDNDCTGHELSIGLGGGAGGILVIIAVIVIIWSRREYKASRSRREEKTRSKFHQDVFFSDSKQTTGMTYFSNNPAYSSKQERIYEEIDIPDEINTKS